MGGEFCYLKGPYDTWGIKNNYLEIIDARFRLILYNLISMMELIFEKNKFELISRR